MNRDQAGNGNDAVNLKILLTEDQRGPFPVSVESLWFKPIGNNFQLKNVPFFIDELSFEDVVSVTLISDDTYEITSVVTQSLNSTVWVYVKEEFSGHKLIKELLSLGCDVESGVIDDYYAVNVPEGSDYIKISELLDTAEDSKKILVSYASMRC